MTGRGILLFLTLLITNETLNKTFNACDTEHTLTSKCSTAVFGAAKCSGKEVIGTGLREVVQGGTRHRRSQAKRPHPSYPDSVSPPGLTKAITTMSKNQLDICQILHLSDTEVIREDSLNLCCV